MDMLLQVTTVSLIAALLVSAGRFRGARAPTPPHSTAATAPRVNRMAQRGGTGGTTTPTTYRYTCTMVTCCRMAPLRYNSPLPRRTVVCWWWAVSRWTTYSAALNSPPAYRYCGVAFV